MLESDHQRLYRIAGYATPRPTPFAGIAVPS